MQREILNDLAQYINRELDEKRSADFKTHLQDCPICQTFLKDFEVILASYQKLSQEKAGTMIADYVVSKMPVELLDRLDHLEKVLGQQAIPTQLLRKYKAV